MYIKYTILLCLTYYTPTASSIDEEEIHNLWSALKSDNNYVYDSKFYQIYFDEKPKELEKVMIEYGALFDNDIGDAKHFDVYRMEFDRFYAAASAGHIQRWSKETMNEVFLEILTDRPIKKFITREGIIRHYAERINTNDVNRIMNDVNKRQSRLYLYNFRRAMNIGLIPEPTRKYTYTSLTAIHKEFCNMVQQKGGREYVTSEDIVKNYEPQLENIIGGYGTLDMDGNYRANVENFISAVRNGHLRIPLSGERITSRVELQTIFNGMTHGENEVYINHENLMKYYQYEIEVIIRRYGDFFYGEYILHFHQFRKVIIDKYLPLKL